MEWWNVLSWHTSPTKSPTKQTIKDTFAADRTAQEIQLVENWALSHAVYNGLARALPKTLLAEGTGKARFASLFSGNIHSEVGIFATRSQFAMYWQAIGQKALVCWFWSTETDVPSPMTYVLSFKAKVGKLKRYNVVLLSSWRWTIPPCLLECCLKIKQYYLHLACFCPSKLLPVLFESVPRKGPHYSIKDDISQPSIAYVRIPRSACFWSLAIWHDKALPHNAEANGVLQRCSNLQIPLFSNLTYHWSDYRNFQESWKVFQ